MSLVSTCFRKRSSSVTQPWYHTFLLFLVKSLGMHMLLDDCVDDVVPIPPFNKAGDCPENEECDEDDVIVHVRSALGFPVTAGWCCSTAPSTGLTSQSVFSPPSPGGTVLRSSVSKAGGREHQLSISIHLYSNNSLRTSLLHLGNYGCGQ